MGAPPETPADQVILATGSYDHTIRFWAAYNGQCHRTVQHPDSVSLLFLMESDVIDVQILCGHAAG